MWHQGGRVPGRSGDKPQEDKNPPEPVPDSGGAAALAGRCVGLR